MKKPIALAVGVFFASTALVHAATTDSTDISFSGKLNAAPCKVDASPTIDLGSVIDSRIVALNSGSKSPSSAVSWLVSFTGCPEGQQIQAVVKGTADSANAGELANQSTDNPAQGVGIAFWQQGVTLLNPNETPYSTIQAEQGQAAMVFSVAMVRASQGTAPVPGNVSTSGQLQITYL
ncbi:fimbrial protein [Hafnia paralvei]|uniref:fimbrial protein n=1 Tax=Hafnia paralvei TaxID=546367 RepID=UPI003CF1FE6D